MEAQAGRPQMPMVERMEIGMADAAASATRVGKRMTVTRSTERTAIANSFRKRRWTWTRRRNVGDGVEPDIRAGSCRTGNDPADVPAEFDDVVPGCISRETITHFLPSTRT